MKRKYEGVVDKGVEKLNSHFGGEAWQAELRDTISYMDMNSCHDCVLGCLFGDCCTGAKTLFGEYSHDMLAEFGFWIVPAADAAAYKVLTREWKRRLEC